MARLLSTALIFVLAGCGSLTFGTELKGEAVVPGTAVTPAPPLNVFPSLGGLSGLDFNSHRDFLSRQVTRDQLTAASVESVTLKILSPAERDFAFLQSLQLVARAGDKEVVFAEKLGVADLGLLAPNPVLALDLKLVDLTPYVATPIVSIVLRGKGTQPPKDTRLEVLVQLRVSASR